MGEGLGWFRVLSFGVYHVRKITGVWGSGRSGEVGLLSVYIDLLLSCLYV